MPMIPEDRARQNIDTLLADAGWIVRDRKQVNPAVGRVLLCANSHLTRDTGRPMICSSFAVPRCLPGW